MMNAGSTLSFLLSKVLDSTFTIEESLRYCYKQVFTYSISRGVAASRFVGRQDLVAYKGLVLTLGSMITIPMVWSM